ncbi:MAG: HEPN domain-containing protein [Candidatus Aenigmarchaeota archaeon]|nr:HEPN domain-containing protein [Candidatus Aenigmarchaeota archaeon]
MKKTNFLSKLVKQGKLELVESSEIIKSAYLKKSENYLDSAKILLKNNHFEESISMAYYSMYYILTALLFKSGIKCENHTGSIIISEYLFGLDMSEISLAKKERIDKQYYVDFHTTGKDAKKLIKISENFNSKIIDYLSKLNNKDIKEARKKLLQLV